MKRIILLFILSWMSVAAATAQDGLHINRLFNGIFKKSPTATEIIVTGDGAKKLGLTVYHSLSVTDAGQGELIEGLVVKDGVKATEKEVEYRNGQLYCGFYTLPQKDKKVNRYIFYLNQQLARQNPKTAITLIYMEGNASPARIKKLIRK